MQDNILLKIAAEAKSLADSKPQFPISSHLYLSHDVAVRLAKELGANVFIVEIGTFLMDCEIEKAMLEGRLHDHVNMSLETTRSLLDGYPDLSNEYRENIEHCVMQHHGGMEFFSLEAEICCNADCYRFASAKGLSYALMNFKGFEYHNLLTLLSEKLEEKHRALSLPICKRELDGQYDMLKSFLSSANVK